MELRRLLETKGFFRVPLKKISSNHYLVTASIHHKEAKLILDTGASTTCINIHCADYFEIEHEESDIQAAGAGGSGMETKISYKNDFEIKGWKDPSLGLVLFDLEHVNKVLKQAGEDPIHGILGSDFLKKHRAVIDYGRNCFYLKDNRKN